jgi:LmbE family N-acetylglucosaminyl deacetylase
MSAAVLSPHLDDAVLSAFSALPARVVNVCTGLPPAGTLTSWDRVCGARDSRAHMEERLEEDRAALAIAGVAEPLSLGFLDVQYRTGPLDADELRRAVEAAAADAAEVWAPAGIGDHRDHLQVRDAAIALGLPLRLYAELPYAVKFGWPAWVTGEEADPNLVPDGGWSLPDGAGEPTIHRLSEDRLQLKLQALRRYRTQFSALSRGKLGHIAHPSVIGFEVSWEFPT